MKIERLKLTGQPLGRAWYIRLPRGTLARWPWESLIAFEDEHDARRYASKGDFTSRWG